MSWAVYDRLSELSTSTGTGAFTLTGARTGYAAFSSEVSINDTLYYLIEAIDGSGFPTGEWETGMGTYSSANTLTRTVPLDGSDGTLTAVTFSAGTKIVSLALSAAALAFKNVRATRSANLTAVNAASAYTAITWDQTYEDTHDFWTVTNPTKLIMPTTIPNDARIQLRAEISLTGLTASQLIEARFYAGGAMMTGQFGGSYAQQYPGTTTAVLKLDSGNIPAFTGDEYEVRIKTGGDTSVDVTTDSWFELTVHGPRY